jgi:two-component system, probable response regulator PhcQ
MSPSKAIQENIVSSNWTFPLDVDAAPMKTRTNPISDMQSIYDHKEFAILYVDDEEKSLKYFTRAFEDQFRIFTASNAVEGLRILEEHKDEIGLIMSDQRMPSEKGVWLLEKSRQLQPRVIRILVTAFADMDAAIAAVNTGSIYKYVSKPWDPPQLESTLKRGLEFFMVQRERDHLLREKMSILHNMMIADRIVSLGLLAAGLSHHIRNSLVAVKTFLDLAPSKLKEENLDIEGLKNPDFWKEYYQNVQGQIEKVNHLLKDLWRASETPPLEFSDHIKLHEIVEQSLKASAEGFAARKISVHNRVPPDLPELLVDKPKFSRLFELLLKDELVSLPNGTEVTFSAEASAPAGSEENEIILTIQDNGPGLPEESLRLIFDPFALRTDSPLEYGINLMACFFIVHHHGGRIEARSGGGQGTTFSLRFRTNPNQSVPFSDNQDFLQKVLLNDTLWEKLMTSS